MNDNEFASELARLVNCLFKQILYYNNTLRQCQHLEINLFEEQVKSTKTYVPIYKLSK